MFVGGGVFGDVAAGTEAGWLDRLARTAFASGAKLDQRDSALSTALKLL